MKIESIAITPGNFSQASSVTTASGGTGGVAVEVEKIAAVSSELERPPSEKDYSDAISKIKDVIGDLNERLASRDHAIEFRIDETLNRSVVTVVDKETGEIVKQLPSDEVIRFAKNLDQLKGILIRTTS